MKKQEPLTGHEQVYHAAIRCQAAALSLTPQRLRGEKKPCPAQGKKERGFSFLSTKAVQASRGTSSGASGMRALSGCKRVGLITGLALPHTIDDADPDVSQRANSHTVTLALSSFAAIVGSRPVFLSGTLPGKLVEDIAQWFQTSKAFVGFGVISAFEGHRRSASQGLHAFGIAVTRPIVAPFEPRRRGARR